MAIEVYINFNGNCREAVAFYADVFGAAAPQIMTFGQMPPNPGAPLPQEAKNLVMHTQLEIGGSNVMFSDVFPGMPFIPGNNISLTFISTSTDRIKAVFSRLSEGGAVDMEPQETFWSKCYAQLTDRFGVRWQLSQRS